MGKPKLVPCLACDRKIEKHNTNTKGKKAIYIQNDGVEFRNTCVSYGSKFEFAVLNIVICDQCLQKYFYKTKAKVPWIRPGAIFDHLDGSALTSKDVEDVEDFSSHEYIIIDDDTNEIYWGGDKKTCWEGLGKRKKTWPDKSFRVIKNPYLR
jgi:hypothetical protein